MPVLSEVEGTRSVLRSMLRHAVRSWQSLFSALQGASFKQTGPSGPGIDASSSPSGPGELTSGIDRFDNPTQRPSGCFVKQPGHSWPGCVRGIGDVDRLRVTGDRGRSRMGYCRERPVGLSCYRVYGHSRITCPNGTGPGMERYRSDQHRAWRVTIDDGTSCAERVR
jgi:hypothetical protein